MGLGEEQTHRLELLAETEEPTLSNEPVSSAIEEFRRVSARRSGHYVIVLMCIAGMIVIWFYTFGRGFLSGLPMNSLPQETSVRSLFANPIQAGIITIAAVTTALWAAVRRRASRLHIQV